MGGTANEATHAPADGKLEQAVQLALRQLGTPYRFGGKSPKGFDCSGLVYYAFTQSGISVPRSSKGYTNYGKTVSLPNARRGDIMVFRETNPKSKQPGHVGIVVSNEGDPLRFVHSSSSKKNNGVVLTDYGSSEHYQGRFMKVVRIP